MQLQDLIARVRKTIGESEPSGYGSQIAGQGTWDNSQIIGYANEGQGILAHDWRKEQKSTITFASTNLTDFAVPVDCLEDGLRTVLYSSNNTTDPTQATLWPMMYLDLDKFLKSSALPLSTPVNSVYDRHIYTIWNSTIKMYPGSAQTTDSLVVYYYRNPATLVNATDVPEIPSRFHIALVEYAIMECQNAVEESNLEYDAAGKWANYAMQFRKELSRNQRDKGVRVRGRR